MACSTMFQHPSWRKFPCLTLVSMSMFFKMKRGYIVVILSDDKGNKVDLKSEGLFLGANMFEPQLCS